MDRNGDRGRIAPILTGAAMGAMALWMLHGALTGDGGGPGAGLAFVLAHLAGAALVMMGAAFGLHRHMPGLARLLRHRPTGRHLALMTASAMVTAGLIHLVHGGPAAWT